MTRNHWVWYLDICGRLSFKSDMYAFFHVFCVAGAIDTPRPGTPLSTVLTFDQSLFINYFEQKRAFGGIVDGGEPESV